MESDSTPLWVAIGIALISAIPGIVQAGYAALAYHRPTVAASMAKSKASPGGVIKSRKIWVMAVFPLLAWLAVGYDVYDRHRAPTTCDECLKRYRVVADTAWADVDPAGIQRFADDYKLYLVLRSAWPFIDEMTDTVIAKSIPYTISTQEMGLAITKPVLRIAPGRINHVNFHLVVLPKDISIDHLLTLGDVKRLGGKIVAGRAIEKEFPVDAGVSPPNPSSGTGQK